MFYSSIWRLPRYWLIQLTLSYSGCCLIATLILTNFMLIATFARNQTIQLTLTLMVFGYWQQACCLFILGGGGVGEKETGPQADLQPGKEASRQVFLSYRHILQGCSRCSAHPNASLPGSSITILPTPTDLLPTQEVTG